MSAFRFELEVVLTQRRASERERQLAVAALERDRAAIEDRIRGIQHRIGAERAELREHLAGERRAERGVDLALVRLQANASLHLVAHAQQEVLKLAGVHRRIDAARVELLRATTARKAVETLRERRLQEWREAERRREDAVLDEISTIKAARAVEAA